MDSFVFGHDSCSRGLRPLILNNAAPLTSYVRQPLTKREREKKKNWVRVLTGSTSLVDGSQSF